MAFNDFLSDTLVIRRYSRDPWGEPTLDLEIEIKCRIERKVKKIVNSRGEEVLSYAKVFIGPDEDLLPTDKLLFDGREHSIEVLEYKKRAKESHHLEIWVS